MNQEHGGVDKKTFSEGASHDLSPELLGGSNKGVYYDSINGRITSVRGNTGDWEKIFGEELVWDNSSPGDWFCLVSASINDDIFELWVDKGNVYPNFIVINGVIMGSSDKMPWSYSHPIQFDTNESCVGGEIFITDHNSFPCIFNIQDIKDNFTASTGKYFLLFNLDLYSTNLSTPLDIIVFDGLIDVGSGGGVPAGSYQYSFRYVNASGDRTNFGPNTPAIPVVTRYTQGSPIHPYSFVNTTQADASIKTKFGVKLRFRVTNQSDYEYIEIRRISYNSGSGVDTVPLGDIIGKISIQPGEISVRTFIDPVNSNSFIALTEEDEVGNSMLIARAKSVRYFDKRQVLMNYSTIPKDEGATFKEYNGKKIFPMVEKLGKAGHVDPKNHAYKKNYMSNDKYSFSVSLFDGVGGYGFAIEDNALKNVTVPSRRHALTGDSLAFSNGGGVTAANVNSVVGPTYELFDHTDAVRKTELNAFRNISKKGKKTNSVINNYGRSGYTGTGKAEDIGYLPYRPTGPGDPYENFDYNVNIQAYPTDSFGSYSAIQNKAFGLNYHTKGFVLGGLEDVPSWAKSFSILRSNRAKRVVCQGLAMYAISPADYGLVWNDELAGKSKNKMWFHSPDIDSGLIPSSVIEDMKMSPNSYKVQFVSPLGFFSEVYNFDYKVGARDQLIDMMSYARVISDDGSINTGEDPSMGTSNHVTYNRYRNTSNAAGGGFFDVAEAGDRLNTLTGLNLKQEGRGSYFELSLSEDIYNINNTGGSGNRDFNDQGMKDWTEPFYIVNIIQEGVEVPDLDVNSYYSTGHYQKIDSIIGIGTGSAGQSFELVDERWEDCIPATSAGTFVPGTEKYVYLVKDGIERVFLNVDYLTTTQVSVIINSINTTGSYTTPLGMVITGIYTHTEVNGVFYINFDYSGTVPLLNEKIHVRYDNTAPIKFYGGDTVVAENTFAPIDKETDISGNPKNTQFPFGIGFPYRGYALNPGHYVFKGGGWILNEEIQDKDQLTLGYIRQMCMMYCAESSTPSNYSVNGVYPGQYLPAVNYVMRPNNIKDNKFDGGNLDEIADSNDMQREYFDDYPSEYLYWKWGGLRFIQNQNLDYVHNGPKKYFSKPKFGFVEKVDFPTGVAWSLPRAVNQQDSPGLKTFLASNIYLAQDDSGEIKKAWDARVSSAGSNLYAICESGTVLFLTKKSILTNINGNDLAVTSSGEFISDEVWISRSIGSNGEMWKGIAEGSVARRGDVGNVEFDTLFIPNEHSVYRLSENVLKEILTDNYRTRLQPSLFAFNTGIGYTGSPLFEMNGHYNRINNEYWLELQDLTIDQGSDSVNRVFVYDNRTDRFIGTFEYDFDRYVLHQEANYGFREGKMFKLETGFEINSKSITSKLTAFSAPEFGKEKEFISVEVFTGPRGTMKPSSIVFKDDQQNQLCVLDNATFGARYLKQYDGWWNQIPRKVVSKDRVQYRLIFFDIFHTFDEPFKISGVDLKFKILK